jgi:hypothetical protein
MECRVRMECRVHMESRVRMECRTGKLICLTCHKEMSFRPPMRIMRHTSKVGQMFLPNLRDHHRVKTSLNQQSDFVS